jgi:hypothetical protein
MTPAEGTYVGDEIIVNCSTRNVDNKPEGKKPMSGARITITGYDRDENPMELIQGGRTKSDGTYTFTPRIEGRYLIQVGSCNYNAVVDVEKNPIVRSGIVEEAVLEPEENDTNGTELKQDIATLSAGEGPEAQASVEEPDAGLLDFVVTGTSTQESKRGASDFMVLLVSFMIA